MRFSIQPEPRPEQNMRTVTVEEFYGDLLEVKESVQKRLKRDAITSFTNKKLFLFYRHSTTGITYRVAIPEALENSLL